MHKDTHYLTEYMNAFHELNAWLPEKIYDVHIHAGYPRSNIERLPAASSYSRILLRQGLRLRAIRRLYPLRQHINGVLMPYPYATYGREEVNESILAELDRSPHALIALRGPIAGREYDRYARLLRRHRRIVGFKFYPSSRFRASHDFCKHIFTPEILALAEEFQLAFFVHFTVFNEHTLEEIVPLVQNTSHLKLFLLHGGMGTYRGETFSTSDLQAFQRKCVQRAWNENARARYARWVNRYQSIYRAAFSLPRVYADTALVWDELKLGLLIQTGSEGRLCYGSDLPYAYFPRVKPLPRHAAQFARWAVKRYEGRPVPYRAEKLMDYHLLSLMVRVKRVCDALYPPLASQRIGRNIFWENAAKIFQ